MKNKTNLILGILLVLIFGLIAYIIFSEPVKVIEPFDDSFLREEIRLQDSTSNYWQNNSKYWESKADSFELKVDSLEALKSDVYEKYDKQIELNNTANAHQLDSFIRANW
jgi:hypothetical protein